MDKIKVNSSNSIVIDGKLFITGLKMSKIKESLKDLYIIRGSTIKHPTFGVMYEYNGGYSRK
jgi:hypothetical protein